MRSVVVVQDDDATPIVLNRQMRFDDSAGVGQVMVHPTSWADVVVLSSFGIVKEDAESIAVPAL
jgi:hypothetical protein